MRLASRDATMYLKTFKNNEGVHRRHLQVPCLNMETRDINVRTSKSPFRAVTPVRASDREAGLGPMIEGRPHAMGRRTPLRAIDARVDDASPRPSAARTAQPVPEAPRQPLYTEEAASEYYQDRSARLKTEASPAPRERRGEQQNAACTPRQSIEASMPRAMSRNNRTPQNGHLARRNVSHVPSSRCESRCDSPKTRQRRHCDPLSPKYEWDYGPTGPPEKPWAKRDLNGRAGKGRIDPYELCLADAAGSKGDLYADRPRGHYRSEKSCNGINIDVDAEYAQQNTENRPFCQSPSLKRDDACLGETQIKENIIAGNHHRRLAAPHNPRLMFKHVPDLTLMHATGVRKGRAVNPKANFVGPREFAYNFA